MLQEMMLAAKAKPVIPIDPNIGKVVLLINMDTPEIVDYKGHVFTPSGAVSVSSLSPFGGYSMAFAGGWLSTPDSDDFWTNNLDFTLEAWVYQPSRAGRQSLYGQANVGAYANGNFDFNMNGGAVSGNLHGNNANNGSITSPSVIPLNTWTHVAYERYGDTYNAYHAGTRMATATGVAGAIAVNSSFNFFIGANPNGNYPFAGNMGPLRMTKGFARFKGNNFIVPNTYFSKV